MASQSGGRYVQSNSCKPNNILFSSSACEYNHFNTFRYMFFRTVKTVHGTRLSRARGWYNRIRKNILKVLKQMRNPTNFLNGITADIFLLSEHLAWIARNNFNNKIYSTNLYYGDLHNSKKKKKEKGWADILKERWSSDIKEKEFSIM